MLILCYAGLVIGIVIGFIGWLVLEAEEIIGIFPLIVGIILGLASLYSIHQLNPTAYQSIVKEM